MSKALLLFAFICLGVLAFNPPHYNQSDPRWGSDILGFGPNTIAQAGCLLTSVTSMVAGENVHVDGSIPNPGTMNSWLKNHGGFSGDLFVWGSIESLGFTFDGFVSTESETVGALKEGKLVILNVMNGGHYVLALSYSSSGYNVMDPANFKTVYGFSEVVRAGVYSF